jgi:plasmid stabilization system protein ParE
MTRSVRIEATAREELAAAVQWYEEQRSGLGAEFLDSVHDAITRLIETPGIALRVPGCPADLPARRIFVRRFPYAVVFMDSGEELRVIAVAHLKRRPGYWVSRTS